MTFNMDALKGYSDYAFRGPKSKGIDRGARIPRQHEARPRNDGYDSDRQIAAVKRRERRKARNLHNHTQELIGQRYSMLRNHTETRAEILYWEGRSLSGT